MKFTTKNIVISLTIVAAIIGGYWWYNKKSKSSTGTGVLENLSPSDQITAVKTRLSTALSAAQFNPTAENVSKLTAAQLEAQKLMLKWATTDEQPAYSPGKSPTGWAEWTSMDKANLAWVASMDKQADSFMKGFNTEGIYTAGPNPIKKDWVGTVYDFSIS